MASATDRSTLPDAVAGSTALRVIPIIRIFDLARALHFYCDFLGCRLDWQNQPDPAGPAYVQVSRGNLVLHLSEHHGDGCPGATLVVITRGLDSLHADVAAREYPFMRPGIEAMPWGARVMEVIDPFGNRLRFSEPCGASEGAIVDRPDLAPR